VINLNNLETNSIIIYVNVADVEINPFYDSGLFLFGFKNGFSRQWSYVIPNIVASNFRYTEFEIELTPTVEEDPENGIITLSPSGNWDYKLWAIDEVTLDPALGVLIDKGQMYLENVTAEIPSIVYLSDNDSDQNIVYLTRNENDECILWSTFPDLWNQTALAWGECL
jgi:hypothetical protein